MKKGMHIRGLHGQAAHRPGRDINNLNRPGWAGLQRPMGQVGL